MGKKIIISCFFHDPTKVPLKERNDSSKTLNKNVFWFWDTPIFTVYYRGRPCINFPRIKDDFSFTVCRVGSVNWKPNGPNLSFFFKPNLNIYVCEAFF